MASNKKFGSYVNRLEQPGYLDMSFDDLVNPFNFYPLMISTIFITWLRKNKLLMSTYRCEECNVDYKAYNRVRNKDGESFRCSKHKNKEVSIRKFSFFEHAKYTFQEMMTFTVEYILGSNMKKAALKAGITYGHTSCEYAKKIREVFMQYVWNTLRNTKVKGTIEIDESQFGRKRKYNKGQKKGYKVWIFGK